jgi:hypothetical protein
LTIAPTSGCLRKQWAGGGSHRGDERMKKIAYEYFNPWQKPRESPAWLAQIDNKGSLYLNRELVAKWHSIETKMSYGNRLHGDILAITSNKEFADGVLEYLHSHLFDV